MNFKEYIEQKYNNVKDPKFAKNVKAKVKGAVGLALVAGMVASGTGCAKLNQNKKDVKAQAPMADFMPDDQYADVDNLYQLDDYSYADLLDQYLANFCNQNYQPTTPQTLPYMVKRLAVDYGFDVNQNQAFSNIQIFYDVANREKIEADGTRVPETEENSIGFRVPIDVLERVNRMFGNDNPTQDVAFDRDIDQASNYAKLAEICYEKLIEFYPVLDATLDENQNFDQIDQDNQGDYNQDGQEDNQGDYNQGNQGVLDEELNQVLSGIDKAELEHQEEILLNGDNGMGR